MLIIYSNDKNVACVGQTIKRAVLLALRVGSFLLSSVFAYFFGNAKSMKKKMTYPLANLVALQRRFLLNDFNFFVINIAIKKTYIKWSVKTLTKGKGK